MKRFATYDVATIFAAMGDKSLRAATFSGVPTPKLGSDRLRMFRTKGTHCVTCGLEGTMFALEAVRDETPHLNLYAIVGGEEKLMTKDHIVPKSKGGANELSNYAPMCEPCNAAKGNTHSE